MQYFATTDTSLEEAYRIIRLGCLFVLFLGGLVVGGIFVEAAKKGFWTYVFGILTWVSFFPAFMLGVLLYRPALEVLPSTFLGEFGTTLVNGFLWGFGLVLAGIGYTRVARHSEQIFWAVATPVGLLLAGITSLQFLWPIISKM